MRLRILGDTKLKRDATCPFCKAIGKKQGSLVEIMQDMNTGKQYASFHCDSCKAPVLMG